MENNNTDFNIETDLKRTKTKMQTKKKYGTQTNSGAVTINSLVTSIQPESQLKTNDEKTFNSDEEKLIQDFKDNLRRIKTDKEK